MQVMVTESLLLSVLMLLLVGRDLQCHLWVPGVLFTAALYASGTVMSACAVLPSASMAGQEGQSN
jgi:hypothetical protein